MEWVPDILGDDFEACTFPAAGPDGVELLLITPTTPFYFDGSLAVGVGRTNSRPSARQPATHGLRTRAPLNRRTHGLPTAERRPPELTLFA